MAFAGTIALTVVSRSHLPFARVLAASLRRHEPSMLLRAVVPDAEPGEAVDLDAEVVAADELGAAPFRRLAARLEPVELCCAVKPFAVADAFARGAERVVYLDADLEIHAALGGLLDPLERADWVVAPHQRSPFPPEPAGAIPSQEDHELCGVLNAGLFAVRAGACARGFLEEWTAGIAAPGSFVDRWHDGRTEQLLFARVLDPRWNAEPLRGPEHDVAYWNLHERPLEERGGVFLAGGVPLASFHWSGFDPGDPARLSRYDSRHPLGAGGALDRLAAAYRAALRQEGWPAPAPAWRWHRTPAGAPLDHRVRALLTRHERELAPPDDPYSPAGERRLARALLAPLPAAGSLMPLLFDPVWRERDDLRAAFPEAPHAPDRYLAWIESHGARETGYEPWLALARDGHDSPFERPPLDRARGIWRGRDDLRRIYADPLGADAGAFADWLAHRGAVEHGLPASCAEAFLRAAESAPSDDPERERPAAARPALLASLAAGELELDVAIARLWRIETVELGARPRPEDGRVER